MGIYIIKILKSDKNRDGVEVKIYTYVEDGEKAALEHEPSYILTLTLAALSPTHSPRTLASI